MTPAEQCTPEVKRAGGCRYRVDCQSGPVDLAFTYLFSRRELRLPLRNRLRMDGRHDLPGRAGLHE
jgi:hypothetical protein